MKSIIKLLAPLFLLSACCNTEPTTESLRVSTDVVSDATTTLYERLVDDGKLENKTIVFDKGEYHFYPEMAYEQFCHISNHNDIVARIALPIIGAKNLTIDGGGSKFIIHGRMIPIWIENSEDVTIKNLTIDYAETFHSEGVVIATDERNKTIDVRYRDEDKYEIRNGVIYFIKPYYEFTLGQTMYFDPKTKSPALGTQNYSLPTMGFADQAKPYNPADYKYKSDKNDDYILGRGSVYAIEAKQIAPQTIRYRLPKDRMPPLGVILVAKGERGPNRFAPGVRGLNTTNLRFEKLMINHTGGMGFIMDNCTDVDLYRCKVVPSAGRVISATADATHFVGCRGLVSLRECTLQSQLDDGINVHGAYQEVQQILDSHTISTRIGHFQQMGTPLAMVGDTVGVVNLKRSFDPYAKLTVRSVKMVNGRCFRVSFNEELPAEICDDDLLENLSAYPRLLIEGCDFSRNRARGILVSTPKPTVIRNNRFSTEMTAILCPLEDGFWYESGYASDVTIEGNRFQDCVYGGKRAPVISLVTDSGGRGTAFRNITIRNNTFNHFDNYILNISNTDSLLFEGNTITNSETYPPFHPSSPVVSAIHSTNVIFRNNSYSGNAKRMIEAGEGCDPIKFE